MHKNKMHTGNLDVLLRFMKLFQIRLNLGSLLGESNDPKFNDDCTSYY